MSFVDLATLTLHRRNELEARINTFLSKCDHAISDMQKLKTQAQSFPLQLNCDPSELKERFLTCMKQLDEYTYLVTDFNLAVGKLELDNAEPAPVHDTAQPVPPPAPQSLNLMDVLSEPASTSVGVVRSPPEKTKRIKVPKEDLLIAFSSTSSSAHSVVRSNTELVAKEPQHELAEAVNNLTITSPPLDEALDLPAQDVLPTGRVYPATLVSTDDDSLWIITDDINELCNLLVEMKEYYKKHHIEMTSERLATMTYCAYYDDDSDCYFRALFNKILEEDMMWVEVFLVDTGELRRGPVTHVQPLAPRFGRRPPSARCCHLAGIDMLDYQNKDLDPRQEEFLKKQQEFKKAQEDFIKMHADKICKIEVDDNSSESLGVYAILDKGETLNNLLVQNGFAVPIGRSRSEPQTGPPEELHSEIDITECPEFEDPVEAVTGYSNRDEVEICKHYKGGPEKTCFKGARCTKKHIMMHPDGWTLDQVAVAGKLPPLPLPAPGAWLRVAVTCVTSYNEFYVQLLNENVVEEKPTFGVVLPPKTITGLVRDMNSPAARLTYNKLKIAPAPGELVAALFPHDGQWYRARVLGPPQDHSIEVFYVDYGNTSSVKVEDVRELEARYTCLPAAAARCVLAGAAPRAPRAAAERALAAAALDRALDAHVVARGFDDLTLELFDGGFSVAEQLATCGVIELNECAVQDDCALTRRVVPA